MTLNSALKKNVRARMAATGENYTTARRAVTGNPITGGQSPLAAALRPGTMTLAISGGGQDNTALFGPELARLALAGHPLVLKTGVRTGIAELPSPVDLAVLLGKTPAAEAMTLVEDLDALETVMQSVTVSLAHLDGPMLEGQLSAELSRLGEEAGKPAVLWVQDVQESGAVLISPYDDEVQQITRLIEVAKSAGAIIAGGHAIPEEWEEAWMPAAAAASEAFVISDDDGSDTRDVTLIHIAGSQRETIPWTIDGTPFAWRLEYNRSRLREAGR